MNSLAVKKNCHASGAGRTSCGWFNPFTAVLAALSLGKRPIEVPNLKSLQLFPIFAGAHERTSVKIYSTEIRAVIEPSNILFSGVYMSTFQPRKFTGLRKRVLKHIGVFVPSPMWEMHFKFHRILNNYRITRPDHYEVSAYLPIMWGMVESSRSGKLGIFCAPSARTVISWPKKKLKCPPPPNWINKIFYFLFNAIRHEGCIMVLFCCYCCLL